VTQDKNQNQNQAPMTIKNPKPNYEPQVKGPELTDRDRLNDILALEKYLTDSFNVSAREASHVFLHQDIMTVLNETHRSSNRSSTRPISSLVTIRHNFHIQQTRFNN
jgi:hypothetical protein